MNSDEVSQGTTSAGDIAVRVVVRDPETGKTRNFDTNSGLIARHFPVFTPMVQRKLDRARRETKDNDDEPDEASAAAPISIRANCDTSIFDWLMRWAAARAPAEEGGAKASPQLRADLVVSVLMASHFLGCRALVEECLAFVKRNLFEVVFFSGADLSACILARDAVEASATANAAAASFPSPTRANLGGTEVKDDDDDGSDGDSDGAIPNESVASPTLPSRGILESLAALLTPADMANLFHAMYTHYETPVASAESLRPPSASNGKKSIRDVEEETFFASHVSNHNSGGSPDGVALPPYDPHEHPESFVNTNREFVAQLLRRVVRDNFLLGGGGGGSPSASDGSSSGDTGVGADFCRFCGVLFDSGHIQALWRELNRHRAASPAGAGDSLVRLPHCDKIKKLMMGAHGESVLTHVPLRPSRSRARQSPETTTRKTKEKGAAPGSSGGGGGGGGSRRRVLTTVHSTAPASPTTAKAKPGSPPSAASPKRSKEVSDKEKKQSKPRPSGSAADAAAAELPDPFELPAALREAGATEQLRNCYALEAYCWQLFGAFGTVLCRQCRRLVLLSEVPQHACVAGALRQQRQRQRQRQQPIAGEAADAAEREGEKDGKGSPSPRRGSHSDAGGGPLDFLQMVEMPKEDAAAAANGSVNEEQRGASTAASEGKLSGQGSPKTSKKKSSSGLSRQQQQQQRRRHRRPHPFTTLADPQRRLLLKWFASPYFAEAYRAAAMTGAAAGGAAASSPNNARAGAAGFAPLRLRDLDSNAGTLHSGNANDDSFIEARGLAQEDDKLRGGGGGSGSDEGGGAYLPPSDATLSAVELREITEAHQVDVDILKQCEDRIFHALECKMRTLYFSSHPRGGPAATASGEDVGAPPSSIPHLCLFAGQSTTGHHAQRVDHTGASLSGQGNSNGTNANGGASDQHSSGSNNAVGGGSRMTPQPSGVSHLSSASDPPQQQPRTGTGRGRRQPQKSDFR